MTGRRPMIAVVTALAAVTVARSGHELPVYPSYYPHEIELLPIGQERAAELLLAGKIQAHVGAAPRFASAPPATIDSISLLGSFVVVRVNPAFPLAHDPETACALVRAVARDLRGKNENFVPHPYPITPFHGDYLYHVDLAEAAKARVFNGRGDQPAIAGAAPRIRVRGELARSLVRSGWAAEGEGWDVEVSEADAGQLIASARHSSNGWIGPAGLRSGWFHAYLLAGGAIEGERKRRSDAIVSRLQETQYESTVERINLERSLVKELTADCRALVAGYSVRREYFSTVFTAGIENIAHDAFEGLNSPMFIRTVKLKDFPWNGWLALGIAGSPAAAWNPIAGFTDEFGRLMWSAVGDPASIPSAYDAGWIFNRITSVESGRKK